LGNIGGGIKTIEDKMKKFLLIFLIAVSVFAQTKDSTLIKDYDVKIKELAELRQNRIEEVLKADVIYNRYDAMIYTLQVLKKEYEEKNKSKKK
jgi:hypothetical protein